MIAPDTNSEMFSCDAARRRTLSYVEGHLPSGEMERMRQHLAICPACAEESGPVYETRRNLRSLPSRHVPLDLKFKLKVSASRAAAQRRARRNWTTLWRSWAGQATLLSSNLMRPFAIPTAGGLVSALVLFSIFASGLTMPRMSATGMDVPTGLYTEASVKAYLPLGFDSSDLMVELTIDDEGRVIDYSLPNSPVLKSQALRRSIENHLLFTRFNPATTFGQPTSGKARLRFVSSRIDVKG